MTGVRTPAGALVDAAGSTRGIRTIEHDGRSLSLPYATLLDTALELAGALLARGLTPGDRVALIVPEVGDFIRGFFGISAAGLVPVPLCPPAQAGDVATFARQSRHILVASRATAVLASADVAPLLDIGGMASPPAVLTIQDLGSADALPRPVSVAAGACALLQFTSGSTAAPKGVVLTHANLAANIAAICGPAVLGVEPPDIAVSWLPLYHDMGLIGMLLSAVYCGCDAVVMSPLLFLKRPTAWLEAIATYRGTVSFAPNFAYELCLRRVKPSQIDALDLSSWRAAGCGAEPIRPDTMQAFTDQFARAGFRATAVMASYGLAEHSVAVAVARGGLRIDAVDAERLARQSIAVPCADAAMPAARLVGCGRAFPGHEIRVVDEHGREVPDRQLGSIIARGPSVMQGYFDDPAATAETLRHGWLHTGDLGYMADGELFVCGRTKDLIIRGGRKYHPADLELAIADVPGVRSSGVVIFGINRPAEADEVVAVLEARASLASNDVVERVRRRVRETAGLEVDRIVITPPGTIPRTTSGKVRRSEARARFQAGTLTAPAPGIDSATLDAPPIAHV